MSVATRDPATERTGDYWAVVTGAVLWGTGGLAGTALSRSADLSMLAVAGYRLLVGGLLVLAVVLVTASRRRPMLTRSWWSARLLRRVLVTGVLAAVYQSSYFVAVGWSSVGIATVIALGLAPVLVATYEAVVARSLPAAAERWAMVAALTGLLLLVGPSVGDPATGSDHGVGAKVLLGAMLAIVSAAGFATMTVLNRSAVPGLDPIGLTGLSFTLGGLLLLPVAAVTVGASLAAGASWGWVLYLGAVPTAAAYVAYFSGLRTVPATAASLIALFEPVTATVGAVVLLHERVTLTGLCGGILLVTAVALLRPRR